MLAEPSCWARRCKHFIGVQEEEEENQKVVCKAFPDGIPDEIAYGNNKHLTPLPRQTNNIVYERVEV